MRVLFAGSPSIAVPSLEQVSRRHTILAVLTGRDQPAGRGKKPEPTPVKLCASALGLPVIEADKVDAGIASQTVSLYPELLVVVAFGRIFKKDFISIFPGGGINLHPSLLPRFRGPSPVSAAILSGDAETGVTIQKLALKFDSGDILAQERVALKGDETTESLSVRLADIGAGLLCRVLDGLEEGDLQGTSQSEQDATYCRLVKKEDGSIDWTQSAAFIERMIRAYDPWPRAYTSWNGQTLLLLKSHPYAGTLAEVGGRAGAEIPAGTVIASYPEHGLLVKAGEGILAVECLQLQFKKALDWKSFLNGHPKVIGSRFGG